MVGPSHFLFGPTTIQSLQNREKMRKNVLDKIALLPPMANLLSFSTFVFPLFFCFFFFFFFFCLDKISSSLHNTYTLVLVLVFFLDKILHSRHWFFLFVFICFFFFNILLAFAYFINK